MATFAITFTVVPSGADGTSPHLERRTEDFAFDDPSGPDYGIPDGGSHAYGPPYEVMAVAVNERLAPGAVGVIQSVEYAHALV
jgi:hypothetical protein